MELVLDANVLFSALIKDSHVRHFLMLSGDTFYAPEFILEEIDRHLDEIEAKSGIPGNEIKGILRDLVIVSNIKIIPEEEFREYIEKAKEFSPDGDDTVYLALALKMKCGLWSNDKELKKQEEVKVYSNEEVLRK